MALGDGKARTCNVCGHAVDADRDHAWRKNGFDILRCPSCGLMFRAVLPTGAELQEIYGPAYFSAAAEDTAGQGYWDYIGDEVNHRVNSTARLQLLERHRSPGRLLDIGCAAGFFLDEARRRGWRTEGVELSAAVADYAKGELDLAVQIAEFRSAKLEAASFDAITMWDYIEHSSDPMGDLVLAANLVRPGGVIALSTGDASSFVARVSGSRWHLLTPRHHNYFFTQESLKQALRSAGFEILDSLHMSSRYTVHYLLHKLRTLADRPLLRRLAYGAERSRVGNWSIPINLYDIVTVVGRRPA